MSSIMSVIAIPKQGFGKLPLPSRKVVALGFAGLLAAVLIGVLFSTPAPEARARAVVAVNPNTAAPILEMNIANNGLVLLRSARVASISGDAIVAKIAWGAESFTWTVRITSDTHFIAHGGEAGASADLAQGDIVTITGQLVTSADQPTIVAQFVRS